MTLVFIEDVHPAVSKSIQRILSRENTVPYCCVRDFDGCEHYITVTEEPVPEVPEGEVAPEPRRTVFVSLKHVVDTTVLNRFGNLQERLAATVGDKAALQEKPEDPAFVCTVSLPSDHKNFDQIVAAASKLRIAALCAPFFAMFDQYLKDPSGSSVKPLVIPYRSAESMYLYSAKGNFYVTISICVSDRDDNLFTRNFLQTFADAKKLEKSISGAPGFSFATGKPPQDLPSAIVKEATTDDVFWATFQLFKKQMEKPADAEKTVQSLANFRNYLSYHIRCCRSNMHAKMRERVETSMQILNRAKTSTTGRARVQIK